MVLSSSQEALRKPPGTLVSAGGLSHVAPALPQGHTPAPRGRRSCLPAPTQSRFPGVRNPTKASQRLSHAEEKTPGSLPISHLAPLSDCSRQPAPAGTQMGPLLAEGAIPRHEGICSLQGACPRTSSLPPFPSPPAQGPEPRRGHATAMSAHFFMKDTSQCPLSCRYTPHPK